MPVVTSNPIRPIADQASSAPAGRYKTQPSGRRRIKFTTVAALTTALAIGVAYAQALPTGPLVADSLLPPVTRPVVANTLLHSGEVALWGTAAVPRLPADGDTRSVELGTRFSTRTTGVVTAILFYKHAANTGVHTGSLWDGAGRRITSVRFTDETARGWQIARLPKPVRLAANTPYVVSYHAPRGRYAGDVNYFGPDRKRRVGPLTATAGVYAYGHSPRFPERVWEGSNYYVDVAFRPKVDGVATTTASPTPSPTSPSASPVQPSPTQTPSASAEPIAPGSAATGCATSPSRCGFPDSSNTGVRAGTPLRSVPGEVSNGPGWHWDSRGWLQVDGNGAVVSGLSIVGGVNVEASDVTIENVRISATGEGFGVSLRHTTNVTIQDSEIFSPDPGDRRLMVGIKDIYGDARGTKVLRNDIWHTSTGVQVYAGLVQDNYIHDMGFRPGDHINGTTDNGGSSAQLILRHNTVFNAHEQTDAISLFQDFGVQANRIIDGNLLAGGGYTIYGGANPGGQQTSDIRITNNRISRLYFPKGGWYGYATAFDSLGPGNVWSGNTWDDTGATIPAP
jgi:Domain of unknown function (DUF4082)